MLADSEVIKQYYTTSADQRKPQCACSRACNPEKLRVMILALGCWLLGNTN
jgi:hypothetical protein